MDETFIGFLYGVCGTLVGGLAAHFLSKDLNKRTEFNQAAKDFVNTFHQELSGVYPYPINWPSNIDPFLRSKFNILNAAAGSFRHCLTEKKRSEFDKTWFRFYNATEREIDNKNCQCYHHYMPFSGTSFANGEEKEHDNTQTYKENLKENVDALLKFAEPK